MKTMPRISAPRDVPGTATLKHVAERAGVSPITVSRALNKPDMVSPDLRDRVRQAVDDLGYVQNRVAGALASASSPVIPVVVPSLSNAVFIETIQGIQDVVQRAGFQLLLGNTEYDLDREHAWISTFLGWSPPGLIVAGTRHQPRTRAMLERWGRPVVEIMEIGAKPIDMNVGLSHAAAGAAMARHLLARGYTDVLFAGCRLDEDYRAGQRFKGFDRTLAACGVTRRPPLTRAVPSSSALGGDMLVEALRLDPPPRAIFYANDDLAVGAILRAQREGIAVPGKIAIAGFNGLNISDLVTPSLTTIVSPRLDIGRLGAEKLLDAIAARRSKARRVDVGFELVVREST
jgi:LacI family transcriptional regulator, gluconate utilization system Gnt-I transcriptional repressor